ncbi:alpha/beta hydrolase [Streptacidiphilus sp. ASG 303]|uniref:alpha/beta fold hydrolase n=1 Tax=Streptacidiphilus sp. ASG 303 TaxID=2896847 RepID=UPI001E3411EE|nr:alpha/beta hydrolase [Streptacidiphilus sp. ASG 303]MCD0486383.1 alpha/beta hydrolase [Streptacidiphilus sp. ASG 303]
MDVGIEPRFRDIDGLRIRYATSRPVGGGHQALLLSPWPESLYAFAPAWSRLAEEVQLVAVDLPGFGHSEGRGDLMSPSAMSGFILRIADAFDLRHPHAVGPDIATSALLFAAAAAPDRFRSLAVGNGGVAYPLQLSGRLKDFVEAPDLDALRRITGRDLVLGVLEKMERQGYAAPDVVREDYLAAYDGDRFIESARYVRSFPTDLRTLAGQLPGITAPVLNVVGAHDDILLPANGEYLTGRLSRVESVVLDTGHFLHETAADAYARLLVESWTSDP